VSDSGAYADKAVLDVMAYLVFVGITLQVVGAGVTLFGIRKTYQENEGGRSWVILIPEWA
jgi:hypothetical protein